jgi:hypothetical protein
LHTVCLEVQTLDDCVKDTEVRSVHKLPKLITYNDEYNVKIYPIDDYFKTKE